MEIDELKPKLQFYKDKIDRYGKKLALGLGVLLVVGTFLYVIKFFAPKAISLETFLIFWDNYYKLHYRNNCWCFVL